MVVIRLEIRVSNTQNFSSPPKRVFWSCSEAPALLELQDRVLVRTRGARCVCPGVGTSLGSACLRNIIKATVLEPGITQVLVASSFHRSEGAGKG